MFFRIIKKDLKRKKTMNIIMLIFILLASMFVSSGLNNVFTVMNGTDYYFKQAGIGDFIVITMGNGAIGALDNILETNEDIEDYRTDEVVWGSNSDLSKDGKTLIAKNSVAYQKFETTSIRLFNSNNEEVTSVPEGHAYVSGKFMAQNDLVSGDMITITLNGESKDVIIDGKVKDALLGSDLMGNTRFILNGKEFDEFCEDELIDTMYHGQICYIDTENENAMVSAFSDASNVLFAKPKSTISVCYVMDMIPAFITLILSICLIIVSFVVLKFSITFTIFEEYREIGVMKAIGIRNIKIRSLYLTKYLMISLVGSCFGFFASIPFGRLLIKSVSENMLIGNSMGFTLNLTGSILVIVLIMIFAFNCTKVVKKTSPLDAIRAGQTGERYKKKSKLRLAGNKMGAPLFMALNDVISAPKRFLTIVVTFCVCAVFVLILVNTTETMDSDRLITTFCSKSDLYYTDTAEIMKLMGSDNENAISDYLDEQETRLKEVGIPAKLCADVQYKYKVTFQEKDYSVSFQQGLNTTMDDYSFCEGTAPACKNEIAITKVVSDMIGAQIGDVITVDFGNEKMDCIITAYFQTMNQQGELIRLHEDAPSNKAACSSVLAFQINYRDNPDGKELQTRRNTIESMGYKEVKDAREYVIECMGALETMKAVQFLLLGITLVVVLLVTVLLERTFIADEKSQIAILKAIGFKDGRIIEWHVLRFSFVAVIAVLLAGALSIPATYLCINPIFGMMGASEIEYLINPVKIFFVYPGIILLMTIIVAFLTALNTKKIKSSDTANIE